MGNEYTESETVEVSRWAVVIVASFLATTITSGFAVIYGFGRSIDVHGVRLEENDRRLNVIDQKLYAPRWSEDDHEKYINQHDVKHRTLVLDITALRSKQSKHARERWHDGAGQRFNWIEKQVGECRQDINKRRVNEQGN